RLAHHQGRREAQPSHSTVRAGEGPDPDFRRPQGAGRGHRQAARGRQDRARADQVGAIVTPDSAEPAGAGVRQHAMSAAVSPLAPKSVPELPAIAGVRLATAEAGIRYKGRTDVLLVLMDKGPTAAGVLTRSKCPSAPVEWCRARLGGGAARALVVNSGNANAFTGKNGRAATKLTAELAAEAADCRPN